jgi:lipopolysaccharide transport protein LptA
MKSKIRVLLLITGLICLVSLNVDAQSFFSRATSRKGANKDVPTVITSDSMDFDISKNVAVFTGNVQVDDANMRILCHQMIVRFEGKPKMPGGTKTVKGKVAAGTDKKKKSSKSADPKQNTKVKDITCIKNVIIIRKLYDPEEKKDGEQKAIAGHAVYDVKTGKITLTDHPALVRDGDTLRGEVIIYWVDSERVSVRSGNRSTSELKIRSKQK